MKTKIIKTTEDLKQKITECFGEEYEVIGEYQGCNIPIKIKHNECKSVFDILFVPLVE